MPQPVPTPHLCHEERVVVGAGHHAPAAVPQIPAVRSQGGTGLIASADPVDACPRAGPAAQPSRGHSRKRGAASKRRGAVTTETAGVMRERRTHSTAAATACTTTGPEVAGESWLIMSTLYRTCTAWYHKMLTKNPERQRERQLQRQQRGSTHLALRRNLGGLGANGCHHAVPPRTVDVPHIDLQPRLTRHCRWCRVVGAGQQRGGVGSQPNTHTRGDCSSWPGWLVQLPRV